MKTLGGFDLLLNLTGDTVFGGHIIPVAKLKRWASPAGIPEIVLDWPDMGTIRLPSDFWKALIAVLSEQKAKMLVFCVGGHGRTGTAIASLMVACGWSSADAIAWVRAHYCVRAIETKGQEQYVRWIAGEIPSLGDALNPTLSALSR
jgi:protein-tyrosine phosphatase